MLAEAKLLLAGWCWLNRCLLPV